MKQVKTYLTELHMKVTAPIRAYVAAPREGRLLPQPNNELRVTGWVQRILGLK